MNAGRREADETSVNAWKLLEPTKDGFGGGTGVLESNVAVVRTPPELPRFGPVCGISNTRISRAHFGDPGWMDKSARMAWSEYLLTFW